MEGQGEGNVINETGDGGREGGCGGRVGVGAGEMMLWNLSE